MTVTLSDEDYLRLLEAAELDDMLLWCETCGAWIDRNDPRAASTEDYEGCWFGATRDPNYEKSCVREARPGRKQLE